MEHCLTVFSQIGYRILGLIINSIPKVDDELKERSSAESESKNYKLVAVLNESIVRFYLKWRKIPKAVSFAVTICLSGQTGCELCLFKNLSQSVRRRLTIWNSMKFLFLLYRRSRVFLWVATTYTVDSG